MERTRIDRRGPSPIAWPFALGMLASGVAVAAVLAHGSIAHPGLLGLFVALGSVLAVCEQYGLPAWQLDASNAVSLVALISCGPLAALLVNALPELYRHLLPGATRPRLIARTANAASFAWGAAAGAAVLQLLPAGHGAIEAWPIDAVAASAMLAVNIVLAWTITCRLVDRMAWRPMFKIIGSMIPFSFVAAGIAAAYAAVGLPALALYGAIAGLPGVLITFLVPRLTPRASALPAPEATVRYARALAEAMELPSAERRGLLLAAGARSRELRPDQIFRERANAARTAFELELAERHGQARLPSRDARVLAFAQAWAGLTAAGTEELSHTAALSRLESDQLRYSPLVIRAAWQVVDEQLPQARQLAWTPSPRPLVRRLSALAAAGA